MKGLTETGDDDYPYIDDEGVSHKTKLDYLFSQFNFCTCGSPVEVAKYMERVMTMIETGAVENSSDGAFGFIASWLDSVEMTEHGGCLPGWLESKGEAFLSDLREAIAEAEAEH